MAGNETLIHKYQRFLDAANRYAREYSGCTKVAVGCAITADSTWTRHEMAICYGANKAMPDLCKTKGCLRVEKYGENTKTHRNPDDCRAIHSEIDAIGALCRLSGTVFWGKLTAYVTRYPCEACARALVAAGIQKVVYGREQEITDMTKEIFDSAGVEVVWVKAWIEEDVTY